jgi:hypothetical protein
VHENISSIEKVTIVLKKKEAKMRYFPESTLLISNNSDQARYIEYNYP